MKLVIMQPYFFPYLGYFQLIHAADRFVFYDDVNYIKNGWINRNRLLLNGAAHYFTVPLAGASPFAPIDATRFAAADERWRRKMRETFRAAYARAPHGEAALALLERVLGTATDSIAELARASVKAAAEHCGLARTMRDSSRAYGNGELSGQARVLDICRREGADLYVNAPGGRGLYDEAAFRAAGLELRFLAGRLPPYRQVGAGAFVPGLSILDIVANCAPDEIGAMLADYELAPPEPAPSSSS
jgi:hypothetical protein